EGGDEKGQGGEQSAFEIDGANRRDEVAVEGGLPDTFQRRCQLVRRRSGHLMEGITQDALFAQVKDAEKQSAQKNRAEREKEKDAKEFAQEIFEAGDRFGENGVDRAVFDILGNETRRACDGQETGQERHYP